MKREINTPEVIQLLVDTFYQKILQDDLIGYVFTDVAKIDLEEHLPIINTDFNQYFSFLLHLYERIHIIYDAGHFCWHCLLCIPPCHF